MHDVVDAAQPAAAVPGDLAGLALGELARSHPQALGLLRQLRLDYCCGGARTLREAAAERGLELQQLEQQIAELAPQACDAPSDPAELTQYIRERFHDTHRAELPELALLARKVERVHHDHPQVPAGLGELLERVLRELSEHMAKEEQILFPMMRRMPRGTPLNAPISRMRDEHVEHAQLLQQLRDITRDGELPEQACNSWRALYAGVAKFADDLVQHIHLENNLLFPEYESA